MNINKTGFNHDVKSEFYSYKLHKKWVNLVSHQLKARGPPQKVSLKEKSASSHERILLCEACVENKQLYVCEI